MNSSSGKLESSSILYPASIGFSSNYFDHIMKGTVTKAPVSPDWVILRSFLPENWIQLARDTGALKGLRKYKCPEAYLRVLLIHLGCGYSLRETVVRARHAGLADLSDVALLKRLRKSKDWLYAMCKMLFQEHGIEVSSDDDALNMRAFDATIVSEKGPTGSQWRIHYSVTLPTFGCDFFKLTSTSGEGTGESFKQFPIQSGDYILADRGYSTGSGVKYVSKAGGYVTIRVNTGILHFEIKPDVPFNLLASVETVTKLGEIGEWDVQIPGRSPVSGRICVLRKTEEAAQKALNQILQNAKRKGNKPRDETLRYARYVILFTTFPSTRFTASEVLEWYRLRWQVELVFKRFKSLAQFGHLPKFDDDSSKAWLYGKLLVALLTEKIVRHARTFSPWGYHCSEKPME